VIITTRLIWVNYLIVIELLLLSTLLAAVLVCRIHFCGGSCQTLLRW
jgi:hypothetical protein